MPDSQHLVGLITPEYLKTCPKRLFGIVKQATRKKNLWNPSLCWYYLICSAKNPKYMAKVSYLHTVVSMSLRCPDHVHIHAIMPTQQTTRYCCLLLKVLKPPGLPKKRFCCLKSRQHNSCCFPLKKGKKSFKVVHLVNVVQTFRQLFTVLTVV